MIVAPGTTSLIIDVRVVDDSGLPVTGLVAATFPALSWSAGSGNDASILLTDLTALTDAFTSGGVKERGGGVYRLDVPNAVSTSAGRKTIRGEATGKRLIVETLDVQYPQVDAYKVNGTTQTARDLGAQLDATVSSRSTLTAANVWDYLASAASTVGSIGKRIADYLTSAPLDAASTASAVQTGLTNQGYTTTRAPYLSNLNVGGPVASQADVNALNQSAARRVLLATVGQYERPETGTTLYEVTLRTYDGDGAAADATTTPTLTATGTVSGSLTAHLSAATHPATGVYRWTYEVDAADTLEQVRLDVSAAMSDGTFTLSAYALVCDFVAATWTTADRANLEGLVSGVNVNYLAGIPVGVDVGGENFVSFRTNGFVMTSGELVQANVTQVNGENVHDDGDGRMEVSDVRGIVIGSNPGSTEFAGVGALARLAANDRVKLAATQDDYAPAKAGDAMTLTGAYDAAKNAASATAVSSVASALAALAAKFTGITLVANWIRLLGRKGNNDATALTEFNATTGAGTGTYDPTTDSGEALRDRGDAAWTTGTGGGGGTARNVNDVGRQVYDEPG